MPEAAGHPSPGLMPEAPPNPELLGALGRLARGLSALFWGLPLALVVCVQSAKGDWFRPLGVVPPLVATGFLYYALTLLGGFQPQERVWRAALERVKILALINLGASPFLYWWNRIPANPFFDTVVELITVSGLVFLILLNWMLLRLTSMLPDETLRLETRLFTTLNRCLLLGILLVIAAYFVAARIEPGLPAEFLSWLLRISPLPRQLNTLFYFADRAGLWLALFFVLLPLAVMMALIWKIKEVILASVFGPEH
jgi:hypothetical protein